MFNFVRDAGWGIFPTIGFGLYAIYTAYAWARHPETGLALRKPIGAAAVTLGAGLLGTLTGLLAAARFVEAGPPEDRWVMIVGMREALGSLVTAVAFVTTAGLIATFVGPKRHADEERAPARRIPAVR